MPQPLPHGVIWEFYAHCDHLALQYRCDDAGLGVCVLVEAMFVALSESAEREAELRVWMDRKPTIRKSPASQRTFSSWSFYITTDVMPRTLEELLHEVVSTTPGWKAIGRVPGMASHAFPVFAYTRGEFAVFFIRDDRPAELPGVYYHDIYYKNGAPHFGLVRLPKPCKNTKFRIRGGLSHPFKVRYADELGERFLMSFDRTEELHPCGYTEEELRMFTPHWDSFSEKDKALVRRYGMPQLPPESGEPASFELTKALREKFPDFMDPAIHSVCLTQSQDKCMLEVVREKNGKDVLEHEDLSFLREQDSTPVFDPARPLTVNARRFLEYFDAWTIVNALDLFTPEACSILYDEYSTFEETVEDKARRRLDLEDELCRARFKRPLKQFEERKLAQISTYLNHVAERDLYLDLSRTERYTMRVSDMFYREVELRSARKQRDLTENEQYELKAIGEFLDELLKEDFSQWGSFSKFLLYCDLKRSGQWDEWRAEGILEDVAYHLGLSCFYNEDGDE